MIMAVASPQVELLISLFFSEDDVNFSYVSYISTSGITTLHTQDIFLEKIKNHANNLIGDHMVTYEIVGVVNFLKISTFSLPIRSIFVKSIPKLFSIKYWGGANPISADYSLEFQIGIGTNWQ